MTDSRVESLFIQARDMCRRVAAIELGDVPLYLLPSSRLTAKLGGSRGCFGFTTGTLDLLLKDEIGTAWRGRGPCIVINDELNLSNLGDSYFTEDLFGIALHELTHVLLQSELFTEWENPIPEQVKFEVLLLAHDIAKDPEPPHPWDGHGLSFIRLFLHLTWRAENLGESVMTAAFCAGSRYGLSSALRYQRLLGDEPARFAKRSLRDLREPYPDDFFNLYLNDLARWEQDRLSHFKGNHL